MPRDEEDREDLLREATALLERVELAISGSAESVVAGFRPSGAASVYFSQDAAYHFNTANQLRRAYAAGLLYRADHGQLAAMRRERTAQRVALLRHDLSPGETDAFLAALDSLRAALLAALQNRAYRVVGQVPALGDVPARVRQWLASLPGRVEIADSPRLN